MCYQLNINVCIALFTTARVYLDILVYLSFLLSFNLLYYSLFFSNSVEQSSPETVDFSASACPCLCLAG
jgi:hypothetical protein